MNQLTTGRQHDLHRCQKMARKHEGRIRHINGIPRLEPHPQTSQHQHCQLPMDISHEKRQSRICRQVQIMTCGTRILPDMYPDTTSMKHTHPPFDLHPSDSSLHSHPNTTSSSDTLMSKERTSMANLKIMYTCGNQKVSWRMAQST